MENSKDITVFNDCAVGIRDFYAKVSDLTSSEEIIVCDVRCGIDDIPQFPVRPGVSMLVLVKGGEGTINIDLNSYPLMKDSVIIIRADSYISVPEIRAEINMIVVTFPREIADATLASHPELMSLFIHHRLNPVTIISEGQAECIMEYFNLLRRKLNMSHTPFTKPKIVSLLQSAILETLESVNQPFEKKVPAPSRREEIMTNFVTLVKENFRRERSVTYYGESLGFTPKHLSAVVKSITGMTAGDWIDNYVILEAKIMLRSLDLSVQQIADMLNFANQSFFGKYFKHITGLTPTEYRHSISTSY